jgi:RHS repeat-associated protein
MEKTLVLPTLRDCSTKKISSVDNYFRDYDPSTGRYLQSDPIGLGGGLNTYAYVLNNPLVSIDLFGLEALNLGGSVKIPGWLFRLLDPDFLGEGGSCGLVISYPMGDNAEFDMGLYYTYDFAGPENQMPSVNWGTRMTLDVGLSDGSVRDFGGISSEISLQAYGFGGTMNFNENSNYTGWEINVGPGINFGGNASMTGVISLRNGIIPLP